MSNLQPVSITSLSPADLEEMGFDASKVTEVEFDSLVRRMSDNYVENYFWHDLEVIADMMNLPRL